MEAEREGARRPRIWAVGGGKGGVGKSVLTTSLAIAVAGRGRRCVLVDADLGGANLHTLLGLSAPRFGLADLFCRRVAGLREILHPTNIPELSLVTGAGPLLNIANPAHAQKMKIIRQLFTLDADDIFLDLGAGTSFTVLDFFLAAHEAIMVITPTPTSVENAYYFFKAAFFRKLKQAFARAGALELANKAMEEKVARGIRTPRDLLEDLRLKNPEAVAKVEEEIGALRPHLLINQVRREEEIGLGPQMAEACSDFFGIRVGSLGAVRYDEKVLAAVQGRRPVQLDFPYSPFSQAVSQIVARLLAADGGVRNDSDNTARSVSLS